ncbi:MAG TPA: class I SAM-dependent methyltransferase [Candidatus Levybacteria bacterium]|nr:class I SAM-dependent methyltransferase [Candidatus Levybacteria bacterium]
MKIKGFQDTIEWYNQNAEQYAQAASQNASLEEIDHFAKQLSPGSKVLDAGCGSGRDTDLLSKKGLNTIGLDYSSGLIKVAHKTFPDIEFVEGNMLSMPFSDSEFNGVWSHASLLHLETVDEVKKALQEFNRVMKQSAVLHVLVKAQTGKDKTSVVTDSLSKHDRFFQYFTKPELENLLKESRFNLISIEQYRETDRNPKGRPEVEWILALARKV